LTAPRRRPAEAAGPPPVSVLRPAEEDEITPRALREVMAQFATGVTVLTAHGEKAHGMTANAFTSVSLDPPMVLSCVSHTARMHDAILGAGCFGVSVLSDAQEDVARYFTNRSRPVGMAQFDEVDWFPGRRTGAPLLVGSLAWLECDIAEVYQGGDHSIFLGTVVSASRGAGQALLFHAGAFHHVGERPARSA
jgi:flavin reductase (DIM6/NTAB) family NADH-FMN oxidoreductase RutF